MTALPDGILIGWYGDDFTGSAAVMEVLSFSGIPALLFFAPPTPEQLARNPDIRAIGIASTARTFSPQRMRAELPEALRALRALHPQILHYKVCSTLDSAPHIGSIGCAAEIGLEVCGADVAPVLIAAPRMGRYQAFGTLFAENAGAVHRLDRHPVMSHHPVTPMDESDVARHLAAQTHMRTATLPLTALAAPLQGMARLRESGVRLACLDAMDDTHMQSCGALLWKDRHRAPFVVGSQGVEYALIAHWQKAGLLPPCPTPPSLGPADGMAVVSGSVSATTAAQIDWAEAHGFEPIALDPAGLIDASAFALRQQAVAAALKALSAGRDPLLYTARGPQDPAIGQYEAVLSKAGISKREAGERLGSALGVILEEIVRTAKLRRAIISGGDTSGFASRAFGAYALQALAPTIPGASICGLRTQNAHDGLQLALKGGQMGSPDYFGWIRDGGGETPRTKAGL